MFLEALKLELSEGSRVDLTLFPFLIVVYSPDVGLKDGVGNASASVKW